ncbi:MAG: hypothetical protein GXO88_07995, partial [Chlorobi bacterium]|nr:hypothetical protein [Chlorobiota bacterium]
MKQIINLLIIFTISLNVVLGQGTREVTVGNQVGTLPGEININPDGSATYSIPINSLPGRAGLEPKLALVYNSLEGDGSLGIGWSISGMQSITRGSTNLYFEDAIDGVDFDNNDRFFLNGERLLKIGDHEYRTEQESHLKIVESGFAGTGP